MDNIRFRKPARIVGWIDLIILILCFFGFILYAVVLAPTTALFLQNDARVFRNIFQYTGIQNSSLPITEVQSLLLYYCLSAVVDSIVTAVQIVVAVLVINSTSLGKDPKSALKQTAAWIIVNVLIVIMYLIWRIVDRYWITLVIGPILRGAFICVITRYFIEVRRVVKVINAEIVNDKKAVNSAHSQQVWVQNGS